MTEFCHICSEVGAAVAWKSWHALLLSVTPPLGPPPHIHSTQNKEAVGTLTRNGVAATGRERSFIILYAQESQKFSDFLEMLLIDGTEIPIYMTHALNWPGI